MAGTPLRIVFAAKPASRQALADALAEVLVATREASEAAAAAYTGLTPHLERLNASLRALTATWRSRHEDPTR